MTQGSGKFSSKAIIKTLFQAGRDRDVLSKKALQIDARMIASASDGSKSSILARLLLIVSVPLPAK